MLLKLSKDFSKTNIIIVIDEKHKAQTKNWQTKNIKHTKKKIKSDIKTSKDITFLMIFTHGDIVGYKWDDFFGI